MESTLFVVLRFIDRYKILYDKEEIRLRLMSDPQFPSLLSVANILDYLHISYKPVQTSLLTLETFKLDCLVHLKNNHHSSFAIIESMRNDMVTYYDGDIHTISTKDFEERWSKIGLCKLNCVMLYSHLISSVGDRPAPRGGTTRPDERKITTI